MTSTFKLIKAEFKKIFKYPSIYIVALLIVATIFGCMYLFEPLQTIDKNITYSGATTAKDYYDYFYSTENPNSHNDIQKIYNRANNLVNYYKVYENKLSSITVGFSDWKDDTGNINDYPTYQWVNYNLNSENFVFTCPSDLPEIHDIHHMPANCRVVRN
jgi:hypothetical protein